MSDGCARHPWFLGGTGGEGDERPAGRVGGDRAHQRFVGQQSIEGAVPDQADDRYAGAQIRLEGHPAEPFGGQEDLGLGGGDDVPEFLAPVEVHDRHGHRTQECRRQNATAASIQLGSCSATTSPGRRHVLADRRPTSWPAVRPRRRCPRRAGSRSAHRSRRPGWPPGRRPPSDRGSPAATTLAPRTVWSGQRGGWDASW